MTCSAYFDVMHSMIVQIRGFLKDFTDFKSLYTTLLLLKITIWHILISGLNFKDLNMRSSLLLIWVVLFVNLFILVFYFLSFSLLPGTMRLCCKTKFFFTSIKSHFSSFCTVIMGIYDYMDSSFSSYVPQIFCILFYFSEIFFQLLWFI